MQGFEARRRLLPRVRRATWPAWGRWRRDRGHRRPRRRGQEHGGAGGGPPLGLAYLDTGRCTAASPGSRSSAGVDPADGPALAALRARRADGHRAHAGRRPGARGRPGRDRGDPAARGEPPGARRSRPIRACGGDGGRPAGAPVERRMGVRRPRRGHRGVPRSRPQGVPDRQPGGARPPPPRRAWRARGVEVDEPTVLEDVRRRDHLDTTRETSPLRVAAGAVVIDSSEMEADDVVEQIVHLVEAPAGGAAHDRPRRRARRSPGGGGPPGTRCWCPTSAARCACA